MKLKIFSAFLILFVILSLSACSAPSTDSGNPSASTNNITTPTNNDKLEEKYFFPDQYKVSFHRVAYHGSHKSAQPAIINSRSELENYPISKFNDSTLYYTHYKNEYIDELFLSYTDEYFFKNKTLVLFQVTSGSGSISYSVEAVRIDDSGNLAIDFNTIIPEVGTADMAQTLVVLELPKHAGINSATPILINNFTTTTIFSDTYTAEFHKNPVSENDYTEMFTLATNYDELPVNLKNKYSPKFFEKKSVMWLDINGRKENQFKHIELSVTNTEQKRINITLYSNSKDIEGPSSSWEIIIEIDKNQVEELKHSSVNVIYK